MAFYFSSDTMAFYDTDVFPVDSLPANKVEVAEADYQDLLSKQNSGYVILSDVSGNPYAVAQGEAPATDINHAASVATTIALGHVKIGNTMQAANDGTLDLKDGAVSTAKIVDANVTADKLASNSVTTAKIADGSVTTAKIVDANVTADKLASNSVTTAKITDANVTADKLASDSVTTAKIADGAVTTSKIVDANVTADKLASNSVTTAKITDANVTADKLASDSVTTAKIADGAVTADKLASGAVTYNKIASNSVDTSHIVNGAINAAKMGYEAVQTPSLADNAVTAAKIADANVTTAKIADGAVTEAKLEAVKDLVADETSLTMTETSNEFTLAVKDGGVSHEKLASTFLFWDPNYEENYAHPKSETTLTSYCTNNCDGKPASIVFLGGITSFTLGNGLMINSERAYKNGSVVLVYNNDNTNTLDVYYDAGSAFPPILIDSIPPNKCKLFVCLISLPSGVSQWESIS